MVSLSAIIAWPMTTPPWWLMIAVGQADAHLVGRDMLGLELQLPDPGAESPPRRKLRLCRL